MVNLTWTPRIEAAFHKVATLHKQHQTDLTHDETETLNQVQGHLKATPENVCVDMDLIKQVSALLLKYKRISNPEGKPRFTKTKKKPSKRRSKALYVTC